MITFRFSEGLPYVADIDSLASVRSSGSVVSKRVRRNGGCRSSIRETAAAAAASSSSEAATAEASSKPTTSTTEATSAAEASSEASSHAAVSTTAAEAHSATASISILTDLKVAALPFMAVELLDGTSSIIGALENDNARTLRATIRADMNISADNATVAS